MKKLLFGLALGALALAVVATKKNEKMSDALKFKNELHIKLLIFPKLPLIN